MEKKVFREILKKVELIEQEETLESFIIASTNLSGQHTMRMKEAYASFAPQMDNVYQDLHALELADLLDEQKFVGGFDGKFD